MMGGIKDGKIIDIKSVVYVPGKAFDNVIDSQAKEGDTKDAALRNAFFLHNRRREGSTNSYPETPVL